MQSFCAEMNVQSVSETESSFSMEQVQKQVVTEKLRSVQWSGCDN